MEAIERRILYYILAAGPPAPFGAWRDRLKDVRVKAAVSARIARFALGNFSDSKPIGDGASETRINLGPGYRIYFGVDGSDVVLLLGGDKNSQPQDIRRAKLYWQNYKARKKEVQE